MAVSEFMAAAVVKPSCRSAAAAAVTGGAEARKVPIHNSGRKRVNFVTVFVRRQVTSEVTNNLYAQLIQKFHLILRAKVFPQLKVVRVILTKIFSQLLYYSSFMLFFFSKKILKVLFIQWCSLFGYKVDRNQHG